MDAIDEMFERVRNNVLKTIFPKTWNVNITEYEREFTDTDPNWSKNKPWHERNRITSPMNTSTEGLAKIQYALRNNNGKYVTIATSEQLAELAC